MTALPVQIENGNGEVSTFERLVMMPTGERLEGTTNVQPGKGPPMHIHFQQEEGLTVLEGRMGYQILGHTPRYAGPGETVVFAPGVAHRFWADGDQLLRCTAYAQPPNNMVYFLGEVFRSMRENGGTKPDLIEAAYLLHKYRSEFAMLNIPRFVQVAIFPVLRLIGRLSGKTARFAQGPTPLDERPT